MENPASTRLAGVEKMPFRAAPLGVALAALVLWLAVAPAAAAPSGTRTSRDGRQVLISKDVGSERWAISMNLDDGTVTGNVFRSDGGDPQFVWCERLGDDGGAPADVQISFSCRGADRCDASPCLATSWTELGQVTLPGSFFLPATDPFSPLRDAFASCDPSALGPTDELGEPSFEMDMNECSYLTVLQPTQTAIAAGDELFVRLWHFDVTQPAPGEAYAAIQIGDRVVWQARLPVPCTEGSSLVGLGEQGDCTDKPAGVSVDPPRFTADFDAPAGTPIYFHLHLRPAGDAPLGLPAIEASAVERPLHSTPDLWHLLEITARGSDAVVDHGRWEVVSKGLPVTVGEGS